MRTPLRVGVTGASGFIGRHVMSALERRGDRPVAVARPFRHAALVTSFRDLDLVVHLAGIVSAVRTRDYFMANVDATQTVARAARDAGVCLVHISSLAAAGPAPASAPRAETDSPSPITVYGQSKLQGEYVVTATPDLRWTILRPGVVYGSEDRALVPLFRYARAGILPLVGHPEAAYTFIYIDDAVRAILAAVDGAGMGDIIFVGYSEPVTPRELVEAVQATAGSTARLVEIPRGVTRAAAWLGDLFGIVTRRPAAINSRRYTELYSTGFVCRVDRMRERLGLTAHTDLRQGLQRAAAWYTR